jgi:hypothetical protein
MSKLKDYITDNNQHINIYTGFHGIPCYNCYKCSIDNLSSNLFYFREYLVDDILGHIVNIFTEHLQERGMSDLSILRRLKICF